MLLTDVERIQYGIPSRVTIAARAAAAADIHAAGSVAGEVPADAWMWLRAMVITPFYSHAAWARWYHAEVTTVAGATAHARRR